MTEPDPSAAAELSEAWLDEDGLRSRARDLSALAAVESVTVRRRGQRAQVNDDIDIHAAVSLLLEGRVAGVQVWYRLEGKHWCDTVMGAAEGQYRVVRMEGGAA